MFKWAVIFLIISLIAGGIGLTGISTFAKRVSVALFALFFLGFLVLLAFAYLLGSAFEAGRTRQSCCCLSRSTEAEEIGGTRVAPSRHAVRLPIGTRLDRRSTAIAGVGFFVTGRVGSDSNNDQRRNNDCGLDFAELGSRFPIL